VSRRRKPNHGDPRPPDKRPKPPRWTGVTSMSVTTRPDLGPGVKWPMLSPWMTDPSGPGLPSTFARLDQGTLDLGVKVVRDDALNRTNTLAISPSGAIGGYVTGAKWVAAQGLDPDDIAVISDPDPAKPGRLVAPEDPAAEEDRRRAERRLRSYGIYPNPFGVEQRQPYHDGVCDGFDERPLSANPHELGTRDHGDWTRGHLIGQQIRREQNGTMGATAADKAEALRWVPASDKLADPVDEVLGGYQFVDRPEPLDAGRLLEHGWTDASIEQDLAVGDRILLDPDGKPRIFTRTDPEDIYRFVAGEERCPACGRYDCGFAGFPYAAPRRPIRFITPPAFPQTIDPPTTSRPGFPLIVDDPAPSLDPKPFLDALDALGAVGQAAAIALKPIGQALALLGGALDIPPELIDGVPEPQNRAQRRARDSGRSFTCRRHGVQHGSFCRLCER
jgi:hypothetical protein